MTYLTLIFAMLFAFLIAIFAVQNSTTVSVTLFTRSIDASLVLVILGAALLGFLTALFLQLYAQLKLRFRLYKAETRLRQLEQELEKHKKTDNNNAPDAVASTVAGADSTAEDNRRLP